MKKLIITDWEENQRVIKIQEGFKETFLASIKYEPNLNMYCWCWIRGNLGTISRPFIKEAGAIEDFLKESKLDNDHSIDVSLLENEINKPAPIQEQIQQIIDKSSELWRYATPRKDLDRKVIDISKVIGCAEEFLGKLTLEITKCGDENTIEHDEFKEEMFNALRDMKESLEEKYSAVLKVSDGWRND